jgi:hypothetical protein
MLLFHLTLRVTCPHRTRGHTLSSPFWEERTAAVKTKELRTDASCGLLDFLRRDCSKVNTPEGCVVYQTCDGLLRIVKKTSIGQLC